MTASAAHGPLNLRQTAGTSGQVTVTILTGTTLEASNGHVTANGSAWVDVPAPSSASG